MRKSRFLLHSWSLVPLLLTWFMTPQCGIKYLAVEWLAPAFDIGGSPPVTLPDLGDDLIKPLLSAFATASDPFDAFLAHFAILSRALTHHIKDADLTDAILRSLSCALVSRINDTEFDDVLPGSMIVAPRGSPLWDVTWH
jgi:hypothetical protein